MRWVLPIILTAALAGGLLFLRNTGLFDFMGRGAKACVVASDLFVVVLLWARASRRAA